MPSHFSPIASAEGWQLSNAPVLSMAAHKASLHIFEEAGIHNLVQKGRQLSGYLLFIIQQINQSLPSPAIEIITPAGETERGCQVSMLMLRQGRAIFEALTNKGVIADWREPDVIRVAPVPLYNSFEDIYHFGEIIEEILRDG